MTLLYLVCLVMILFAFDLFKAGYTQKLLPIMKQTIGRTTEQIKESNPNLLNVFFTVLKVNGALFVSFAVGLIMTISMPFRQEKEWSVPVIFVSLGIWLALAIVIYFPIPNSPLFIWVIAAILTAIAFILSVTVKDKGKVNNDS
jgi:hypothetical protein